MTTQHIKQQIYSSLSETKGNFSRSRLAWLELVELWLDQGKCSVGSIWQVLDAMVQDRRFSVS